MLVRARVTQLESLSPAIRSLRFLFMPSVDECCDMVRELETAFGNERNTAVLMGVSVITLRSWKNRRAISVPSRRAVWLIWVLLLHPERIETAFDLVTWGRFKRLAH